MPRWPLGRSWPWLPPDLTDLRLAALLQVEALPPGVGLKERQSHAWLGSRRLIEMTSAESERNYPKHWWWKRRSGTSWRLTPEGRGLLAHPLPRNYTQRAHIAIQAAHFFLPTTAEFGRIRPAPENGPGPPWPSLCHRGTS